MRSGEHGGELEFGAAQDGDRKQDRIDALVDAALRSYTEPAEIPDGRAAALALLERARGAESRRQWPRWRWAIPVAVCLVALVMGTLWLLRTPRIPEVVRAPALPRIVAQVKTPAPPARRVPVSATPISRPRVTAAKSRPLPKLDVFPAPTPLSPQEQALLAFAKHGPPEVQRAVLEDQKHWDDPIIVADLREQPPQSGNSQDQ